MNKWLLWGKCSSRPDLYDFHTQLAH